MLFFFLCVYVCVSENPEKPLVPLSAVEEKQQKEELLSKNHWPKQHRLLPFLTRMILPLPPSKKKSLCETQKRNEKN